MTREELKAKIREKKIRRAFKIMRFRSLKNFFIWLTGAMMSFVIFFLTVFVAVGVVPIGTYTGGESDEVVGEAISDKSLYQAIMDFNTYKIGDIPALSNALTQIINESGLDQYVSIDVDKLNNIKFVYDDDSTDMMTELTSCIKVTASIETVMSATDGSSGLGDFGNLSVFSSYGEIAEYVKAKVKTDDNGLVNDDPANYLIPTDYYYFDEANSEYHPAFSDSGDWAGDVKRDVLYVKNKDLPKVDTNGDITKNAEGEFNSNPKLYYYDANSVEVEKGGDEGGANPRAEVVKEPKWERAFDDNGKRVAPLNVKLHYANLSKVPILEAIDLIDESLGRLELTELLDVFAKENTAGSNNLIGSILGDKTISDIMTLSFEDITLTTFLPYVEYKDDGTTIKTDNRELYKILLQVTGKDLTGLDDNGIKKLADEMSLNNLEFSFENVKLTTFLPYVEYKEDGTTIKTDNRELYKILLQVTGKELTKEVDGKKVDLTDDEIKALADDMSLGELEFKIDNIALGIIMKDKDNEILNMLVDMVNEKLEAEADGEEFTAVTVDTLNVGHIQSVDTSYIKLTSFIPYYEKDDQGNEKDNKELYKILLQATGKDLTGLVDSGIKALAEDLSLSDLSSKCFAIDKVKLTTVLPCEEIDENGVVTYKNIELYKILLNANGTNEEIAQKAKDLSINGLNGLDIQSVKLSTVMQNANEKLQSILSGALNDTPYTEITIGDLSGSKFNINNVKLTTVLPCEEIDENGVVTYKNIELYKILLNANGTDEEIATKAQTLSIKDINDINIDNVKLSVVMDSSNDTLKNLLSGALNGKAYADITIADLGSSAFNIDNVKLSTVLPYKDSVKNVDNSQLYKILLDCKGMLKSTDTDTEISAKAQSLSISDINNFSIDNVRLSTVLTSPDNSLKSILEDVYVNHTVNVGDEEVLVTSYEDITLSMLASFKMEDLHLYKVLPAPSGNLKSILEDAFDDNYEGITVSMLSGDGFNFDKVSLKTVVGETSSNPIIQALIESDSSVGGIGDAINELSLYKVYGANIFTTTPVENSPRYTLSEDKTTYTLKDDGEYYLSEDAGIWLLICFDSSTTLSSDANHKGRPISYTVSSATIADLQGGNENSVDISSAFTHATVRQLIDAGIIESANVLLYDKTLEQALNATLGGIGG